MHITRWMLVPIASLSLVACSRGPSADEQLRQVAAAAPWVTEMLQHCEAYKTTQADAARNDLAGAGARLLRGATVKSMQGRVERVMPSGPDEYSLQIEVAGQLRFASQPGKRAITRGDGIYEEVATLHEGDCVQFSAEDLEPIATFQMAKLCDLRYYGRFGQLTRCAQ